MQQRGSPWIRYILLFAGCCSLGIGVCLALRWLVLVCVSSVIIIVVVVRVVKGGNVWYVFMYVGVCVFFLFEGLGRRRGLIGSFGLSYRFLWVFIGLCYCFRDRWIGSDFFFFFLLLPSLVLVFFYHFLFLLLYLVFFFNLAFSGFILSHVLQLHNVFFLFSFFSYYASCFCSSCSFRSSCSCFSLP